MFPPKIATSLLKSCFASSVGYSIKILAIIKLESQKVKK